MSRPVEVRRAILKVKKYTPNLKKKIKVHDLRLATICRLVSIVRLSCHPMAALIPLGIFVLLQYDFPKRLR